MSPKYTMIIQEGRLKISRKLIFQEKQLMEIFKKIKIKIKKVPVKESEKSATKQMVTIFGEHSFFDLTCFTHFASAMD